MGIRGLWKGELLKSVFAAFATLFGREYQMFLTVLDFKFVRIQTFGECHQRLS